MSTYRPATDAEHYAATLPPLSDLPISTRVDLQTLAEHYRSLAAAADAEVDRGNQAAIEEAITYGRLANQYEAETPTDAQ